MKIGIASDHGGYELKNLLKQRLSEYDFELIDFGNQVYNPGDDFPDYIVPLAQAVGDADIDRGIAVCGSGVGASIVANKVSGVRAALIHDQCSAHQGVEDDDMNVLCLGGRIIGIETAIELVITFLNASFSNEERHKRRLRKVSFAKNNFFG